jgi:hypothetical protein
MTRSPRDPDDRRQEHGLRPSTLGLCTDCVRRSTAGADRLCDVCAMERDMWRLEQAQNPSVHELAREQEALDRGDDLRFARSLGA